MIHTQAEAKGCVRPSVRPRTSQSDCRILCQPVASGVVLVAGVTSAMRHARAMARRSQAEIPVDLRARLETARLNLLALFRALDRMDLSPAEIPQRLIRQLFELDADYAEALWALDQPLGSFNVKAMVRDTLISFPRLWHASAK